MEERYSQLVERLVEELGKAYLVGFSLADIQSALRDAEQRLKDRIAIDRKFQEIWDKSI